jgi:hypothetical protein
MLLKRNNVLDIMLFEKAFMYTTATAFFTLRLTARTRATAHTAQGEGDREKKQ